MKAYVPFCEPQDKFERRLVAYEILGQTDEITFIDPPGICDLCGAHFNNKRLMIDTCLEKNKNPWGCICAECFYKYDLELGWGK